MSGWHSLGQCIPNQVKLTMCLTAYFNLDFKTCLVRLFQLLRPSNKDYKFIADLQAGNIYEPRQKSLFGCIIAFAVVNATSCSREQGNASLSVIPELRRLWVSNSPSELATGSLHLRPLLRFARLVIRGSEPRPERSGQVAHDGEMFARILGRSRRQYLVFVCLRSGRRHNILLESHQSTSFRHQPQPLINSRTIIYIFLQYTIPLHDQPCVVQLYHKTVRVLLSCMVGCVGQQGCTEGGEGSNQ